MRQLDETPLAAHEQPGPEAPQVQRIDVDPAPHRRVGGVEHLEAAVEEEAVDLVGALAPTHGIRCLEHHDREPGVRQHLGAPQPGQPGPHDHDIGVHEGDPTRERIPAHAGMPILCLRLLAAPGATV